jgi:hypothetical protein
MGLPQKFFQKSEYIRALAEARVKDQWAFGEENEIEEAEVPIEDHESQLELMTRLELKAELQEHGLSIDFFTKSSKQNI